MNIQYKIANKKIIIIEPQIKYAFFIEQLEEGNFFVFRDMSDGGHICKTLPQAMKKVNKMIKNYFVDRCEPNPINW